MEKIKVLTSQNVAIEYKLALVGERIISNIIDILIQGSYAFLIFLVLNITDLDSATFVLVIYLLPTLLYHPLCEIFMNGQSPGMRVRNIKVIDINGKELSLGSILLRSLLRIVDVGLSFGAVALISISATEKGQRLGDLLANTTVVKVEPEATFEDIRFTNIDPNYQPVFEQVKTLKDQDIALIKEALSFYEKTSNRRILENAATKVKTKLAIETTMTSKKFLNTIIKDYNFYTGTI